MSDRTEFEKSKGQLRIFEGRHMDPESALSRALGPPIFLAFTIFFTSHWPTLRACLVLLGLWFLIVTVLALRVTGGT